jgi:hypothetical protein
LVQNLQLNYGTAVLENTLLAFVAVYVAAGELGVDYPVNFTDEEKMRRNVVRENVPVLKVPVVEHFVNFAELQPRANELRLVDRSVRPRRYARHNLPM